MVLLLLVMLLLVMLLVLSLDVIPFCLYLLSPVLMLDPRSNSSLVCINYFGPFIVQLVTLWVMG